LLKFKLFGDLLIVKEKKLCELGVKVNFLFKQLKDYIFVFVETRKIKNDRINPQS